MIILYRTLTILIYPLLIILVFLRRLQNKEDAKRYKEKIFPSFFNVCRKKNTKLIWFHAASIGELNSILPIIKNLNESNKNFEFLITTVTLSSSNLAKEKIKNFQNVYHRFFPIDVRFIMKKFLLSWKPDAIFFVDSEIWPNIILEIKKLKIPIALINARITSKTFKKWMYISKDAKKIFNNFDMCLASNLETKKYLENLNANKIIYTGNIKLINKVEEEKLRSPNDKILEISKFWIAASTHRGEENFCLNTHLILKKRHQNIITILAPRHIDRAAEIKKLCDDLNLSSQILTKDQIISSNKEILIINSFGALNNFYKFSKSVFIGKSLLKEFDKVGGQNPIDAAKLGCKIYHGPFVYNFNEIYDFLNLNNISKKITSADELAHQLTSDFDQIKKDTQKFADIINKLGSKTLNDTMTNINKFLVNEIK